MDDFPGNSHREREATAPPKRPSETKKIESVVKGEVIRRRRPLGRRFKETFVGGDAKSVWSFVILDVMIPAAKDMFAEASTQFVERMIFGESRSRRPSSRRGNNGYVSYNRMSDSTPPWQRPEPRREVGRRVRESHDFDEIVIESRGEAEEVLDRLFDLIENYKVATVTDLYELTNITGSYVDDKWGWYDLRGAHVQRVRGGYILNMPRPEPLEK